MGVITTKYIKAGEEILTYYGYQPGLRMPRDYPWYWELKTKTEHEGRLEGKIKRIDMLKGI